MTKTEDRTPKEIPNPKPEQNRKLRLRTSLFALHSSLVIRHSDL
jgi:hypothetical protein